MKTDRPQYEVIVVVVFVGGVVVGGVAADVVESRRLLRHCIMRHGVTCILNA